MKTLSESLALTEPQIRIWPPRACRGRPIQRLYAPGTPVKPKKRVFKPLPKKDGPMRQFMINRILRESNRPPDFVEDPEERKRLDKAELKSLRNYYYSKRIFDEAEKKRLANLKKLEESVSQNANKKTACQRKVDWDSMLEKVKTLDRAIELRERKSNYEENSSDELSESDFVM